MSATEKPVAKKKRKKRESFGAIRRRSSGRYQASYLGPDGVRYNGPVTYSAEIDARAWLLEQRKLIERGTWQADDAARIASGKSKGTFDDWAHEWLELRNLRPRTRTEYERLLATTMQPLADMRLNAITRDVVSKWYVTVKSTGKLTQASRAYGLLKAIMTTAVEHGRIPLNPCVIRGASTKSTGKKVEPPTKEELAVIVESITDRYRAAVLLAAWAGVRYGELTELRRADLVLTESGGIVVNVSRAVTQVTGQGYVIGSTKSAAGMRSINLPPHVVPAVLEHLDRYVDAAPNALLFAASDGVSHLAQSTFVKHYYPAREAAGRPDMPWHALRHHGATQAARAGATLKELQERLGHSTVRAAMAYQHSTGRDEELAKRMSELADT